MARDSFTLCYQRRPTKENENNHSLVPGPQGHDVRGGGKGGSEIKILPDKERAKRNEVFSNGFPGDWHPPRSIIEFSEKGGPGTFRNRRLFREDVLFQKQKDGGSNTSHRKREFGKATEFLKPAGVGRLAVSPG